MCLFGAVFVIFSCLWAYLAYAKFWPLLGYMILCGYIGFRLLRNAFRRYTVTSRHRSDPEKQGG